MGTRKLGVQEDELKRSTERAELAEGKLKDVEQELEAIGDNMKQLEISAEKAQEREEKLVDKIHTLMERLKVAEARFEYGEMNVSKLNLRIDDIEDEIYREKLKIKKVSDELSDTFDDMFTNAPSIRQSIPLTQKKINNSEESFFGIRCLMF